MTKEQESISRKNYNLARKRFNLQKGYVLHHIDPSLRHNDIDRYIQWNDEDLMPLTVTEHNRLHAKLGRPNVRKGYHLSEEHKQKIRDTRKEFHIGEGENNSMYGKHWYTNGIDNVFTLDCP